jgi:RNA polymerase sigma-70 factor (ECF subfamily)
MYKDSDTALINDCKLGDPDALRSLVARYERPVYNAAYRMMGNPDDAADVTQAAFLKVFEHLDRYDSKYKFFSWIYRITINESIDQLKRRGQQQPLDDQQVSGERGPEDLAAASVLCDSVQAVLMNLQQDYRSVIVLRHFTECSYGQIAEILQIPEKTVKSRLYSSRQLMKQKLAEQGVLSL